MAELKKGDWLCFLDPGVPSDVWGKVVRCDPDGSCALWFGELRIIDYAPGIIQEGISAGTIVVREK